MTETANENHAVTTPDSRRAVRRAAKKHTSRVRWIAWSIVAVVLLLLAGWVAWLGVTAVGVKDDLEKAKSVVGEIQTVAGEGGLDGIAPLAEKLDRSVNSAVAPTGNLLWRTAEYVPVLGENFRAVRVVAESINSISDEVIRPAVALLDDFELKPNEGEGGFDLTPLAGAQAIADTADTVLAESLAQIHSINTDQTLGVVKDAVGEFDGLLSQVADVVPQVQSGLTAVTTLLGVHEPQQIVLAFLNNAEATGLGGAAASQSLLAVDNGSLQIVQQTGVQDFPWGTAVDISMDDSATQLFDTLLMDNLNAATSRPDFPTAARLISANWERTKGVVPDAVIALDPLALSKMLAVTGPVALESGEQLTADNAVSLLLNEAYARYETYDISDGTTEADKFFGSAAKAIFEAMLSADYDIMAMVDALTSASDAGSVMMWSADPKTQSLLDGTRLQGVLPPDNVDATVFGVYFRDRSASKIDYYMHSEVTVTTNTCVPESPSFDVEVRFWLDFPDGVALPRYVRSQLYNFYRTEVFLYGPAGASIASAEANGDVRAASTDVVVDDLGRPAVKSTFDMTEGQVGVARAIFDGVPEEFGPPEARVTPMVNATSVTLIDTAC